MHAHLFVHATDSRLIASKNRSQRHPSRLRQECKLTSFLPFQFLDHTGIRGSNGSALASIWVIERVDHQRSAGRVQLISDSATRWRTHRRWRASERLRYPACPARTLWNANPHRSPLHFTNAGCAIGNRSQLHLASDRKLYGRHHWRHTAINWRRMTRRGGEQPLDDCSVMGRQRPRAATAHSFRMRFWATKYSFRANCQPGSDCKLFELGRISQEATERLSTCWPF